MELRILTSGEDREHIHPEVELIYVLDGLLGVNINEKEYVLNKNGVILINSNNRHAFTVKSPAVVCQVSLKYYDLLENLQKDFVLLWCNSSMTVSAGYGELVQILDDMIDAWVVTEKGVYVRKSLYYKLVGCLADHFLVTENKGALHGQDNFRRDAMLQYINANYFRSLTLKELADRMYMSESAFSKYFKKTAGINFVEYLGNIRLHYAVEDLLYSDKPITRVAVDNGFPNPSWFNKAFKAAYHTTPKLFRSSMAQKSGEGAADATDNSRELARRFLETKQWDTKQMVQEKYIYAGLQSQRPYKNGWNRAMNLGAAADLLSARLQQQVAMVRENLGFEYGRLWNIFSWNMKIRENHLSKELKFDSIDNVLDFLVDHQITPMIELGDKYHPTYRNCSEAIFEEEKKDIFQSVEEYAFVLNEFMTHVVRRYGRTAVSRWIFELWFDPGTVEGLVMADPGYNYTEVFQQSAKIIKALAPDTRLGGAGIRPGILHTPLEHFFENISKFPYPPDFISMYSYPYCWIDENDIEGSMICPHTEFIRRDMENYGALAKYFKVEHIPVYITEWNMSLSERNFYNDSCGKAALMLKNMVDHLEDVDLAIYWSVSDLWSDYYDSNQLLFGGGGLLSKEGIAKPSYYAMEFMSRMYPLLVERGDGYMITADGNGRYAVLCFNYKAIGQNYYIRPESSIDIDDLEGIYTDNLPAAFHFSLTGIAPGRYCVRKYRITPEYGSVLGIWQQLGKEMPVREDGEYMRRMCSPRIEVCYKLSQGNTLVLDELLKAHEMRLIFIST